MFAERFQRIAMILFLAWLTVSPTTSKEQEDSLVLIRGNVTFAALMEVNEAEGGACSDYDVITLQEVVAVTWMIDALNEMDYVPGVKIGLDVYRTCKLPTKAARGAVALLNKYGVGQEDGKTSGSLFGILGPGNTAEARAVSNLIGYLPVNQRLLQISGSSTGKQLSDRTLHPNFFRVIPHDGIQVKVMLQLLLQLQWNYVAIVYDDDEYGRPAAEELRRLAQGRQLCIPVFASLPLDSRSSAFTTAANSVAQQLKNSGGGAVRGLVILGSTSATVQLLQILNSQVTFTELVLSETVGVSPGVLRTTRGDILPLARGALVTSPPYIHVPEFALFWSQLWTNESRFSAYAHRLPWLAGYFAQLTGCDVVDPGCWDQTATQRNSHVIQTGGRLSVYIGYQIKAAAVMAALLKRLHGDKCGWVYSGLCPDLENSIAARHDVQDTVENSAFPLADLSSVSTAFNEKQSVRFNSSGDVIVDGAQYTVYNLKTVGEEAAFHQVGTFDKDNLTLRVNETEFYSEDGSPVTWDLSPPAQCNVNYDCLQCQHDLSSDVLFVEGDFYVTGLLPITTKNPDNLLQCGEVKGLVGADLAQALVFAVEEINNKNGAFSEVLPGKKVGLLVINSCASPLHVQQLLMELYAGTLALPGGRNSSQLRGRMMGMVGSVYSADSIAASSTLSNLERNVVKVLVSPGATSPELKDRTKYPYFMRLIPADDTQAQAMLDIVGKIGANYIQVIYDKSTAYASALHDKLQEEIRTNKRFKVCIAQSIGIWPQNEASHYKYIADKLMDNSAAKVIIVILHTEEISKVMDAILPLLKSRDNFLFLASETWGRRQEIIAGRTLLHGSLVLAQEIAMDRLFERYFAFLDPSRSHNPWLNRFWETRFNCYMNKSFRRKGKAGPCPDSVGEDYRQDSLVPLSIQSTYAVVQGFDQAMRQHCARGASSTCESLNSSLVVSAMRDVQLDLYSTGQTARVFDANGDGLVGYKILGVSRDFTSGGDLIYKDVGSWTPGKGLSLEREDLTLPGGSGFVSVCPNAAKCDVCFPDPSTALQSSAQNAGVSPSVPISIGVVFGVIIIVLIVVIVFLARRRNPSPAVSVPSTPISSCCPRQELSRDRLTRTNTANESPHFFPQQEFSPDRLSRTRTGSEVRHFFPQQELSCDWLNKTDTGEEVPHYAIPDDVDSPEFWESSSDGYLHPIAGSNDTGVQPPYVSSNCG